MNGKKFEKNLLFCDRIIKTHISKKSVFGTLGRVSLDDGENPGKLAVRVRVFLTRDELQFYLIRVRARAFCEANERRPLLFSLIYIYYYCEHKREKITSCAVPNTQSAFATRGGGFAECAQIACVTHAK